MKRILLLSAIFAALTGCTKVESVDVAPVPSHQVQYISSSTSSPIELDAAGTVYLSFVSDETGGFTGSDLEIRYKDGGSRPSEVIIDGSGYTGGSDLNFTIDLPDSRVEAGSITLNTLSCKSSGTKMVIAEDADVTTLSLTGGDVAVNGSVNTLTIPAENVTSDAGISIGANDEAKVEHITNESLQTIATVVVPDGKTPADKFEATAGSVVYAAAVAKIGSTTYPTLAAALAAVQNGQTIVMLKNDTGTGLTSPMRNYTIDFNGYSFSGKPGAPTTAFKCTTSTTILLKNGSIKCTSANKTAADGITRMISCDGANLTFSGMTIDATYIAHKETGTVRDAVVISGGSVEFKGNTNIKAPTTDYAFKMSGGASVTWNSTGLAKGAVGLDGGTLTIAKAFRANAPIIVTGNEESDSSLTLNAKISTAATFYAMEGISDAVVMVKGSGRLNISGNSSGFITAGSKQNYGVKMNGATLTMTGGTIEGTKTGMYISAGTVTLNGGAIKGASDAIVVHSDTCKPSVTITGTALTSTGGVQVGATFSSPATGIADIYSTDNTLTTYATYDWVKENANYKLGPLSTAGVTTGFGEWK